MLGIYVHIPFCASRCGYCDFATAPYDEGAAARYVRALRQELGAAAPSAGSGRADTVYLGGGTPTALGPERLRDILTEVTGRFAVAAEAEVTCEVNPESLTAEALNVLVERGVNRLSLGLQTFDDGTLKILGRRHDAAQAEDAYWRARAEGFENISIDLMYGLPGQSSDAWVRDLEQGLALKPDHVSLYGLTLEPHVKMYRERASYEFPGDDDQAAMYYSAVDTLTAAGFVHYETSNFARPGRECRHNLKYWRDGEYVGFGPSAASHWRAGRYRNPPELNDYCAAAATGRWPLADPEPSDAYREMRTAAVLGLRLIEGIDAGAFGEKFGVNPQTYYQKELAEFASAGLVMVEGDHVRLSREGLFLADEVFAALI
jgi:oxygen-independent coproporphyrinogen-3 oxidase